jgi:hypothetical protein
MYDERFREEEWCAIDKNLFLRKPIENEKLIKKLNTMIS